MDSEEATGVCELLGEGKKRGAKELAKEEARLKAELKQLDAVDDGEAE